MKKLISWLYFKFVYKNNDKEYIKIKTEYEELKKQIEIDKNNKCSCGVGDACNNCKL